MTAPVWLRIEYMSPRDPTIEVSVSEDGVNWRGLNAFGPNGSQGCCGNTFGLPSTYYVGVAVTSHDNSQLTTSHIEGLSLITLGLTNQDIGTTGLTGNTVVEDANGTSYTIQGAGADIWGTQDAFQFVYQQEQGSSPVIQLHVKSEQATDPFAKVGIMIRNGLAANAAFVILDMKPSGELEFMQRMTDGDSVNYLGGAAPGFTWIRLLRQDSTVTAYGSSDGSNWTQVGTTSVNMPTAANLGIAVTSHNTTQLNTGTVDNVGITDVAP
jgi:hypothetical protein